MNEYHKEARELNSTLLRYCGAEDSAAARGISSKLAELDAGLAGRAVAYTFAALREAELDIYSRNAEAASALFKELGFSTRSVTSRMELLVRNKGRREYLINVHSLQCDAVVSDIPDWFAFSASAACYSFSERRFFLHERFLPDVCARRLVHINSNEPLITALCHALEYVKRGFTMSGGFILSVALHVQAMKIETYGDLKRYLLGADTPLIGGTLSTIPDETPYDTASFVQKIISEAGC
jgi:hypothetical protein